MVSVRIWKRARGARTWSSTRWICSTREARYYASVALASASSERRVRASGWKKRCRASRRPCANAGAGACMRKCSRAGRSLSEMRCRGIEDFQRFHLESRFMTRWIAVSLLVTSSTMPLTAQNQVANVPRTSDGKPDLSGVWQTLNTAAWDIQDHSALLGVPAGQGVVEGNEIPYQPSAAARKRENYQNRRTADSDAKCFQPGVPRITDRSFPFQIVQTPVYSPI